MRVIKKSLLGLTAAAVVQFAGGFAAEASTVNLTKIRTIGQNVSYSLDGSGKSHLAGAFEMTDGSNTILTWCIDLFNTIQGNADYVVGDSFIKVPGQDELAAVTSNLKKLFTAHYEDALNSAANAAAFQLVVWEITVDTATTEGLDLADGRFQSATSGGVYGTAKSYLDSVVPGADEGGYRLTFFDSIPRRHDDRSSQNLVSASPVPLPAGMLLLGTGMAGLGFMRRRRGS